MIIVPPDQRGDELIRLRIQCPHATSFALLERRVDPAFGGNQDLHAQLVLSGFVDEARKHNQLQ
ncbi:hypothetical protein BURMUCGD2_6386 [Burkholderia multivorans CGD2]|uniref:Uncharacterized protein n=1 Tax=Burkholderia multivorans CGD2 TaxID=513052 RepID=B9BNW6_9BURK|nr:hypothetical protein BURMUCGD2_6386 [Burkholderia multivorans CGD2]